MKKYFYLLLFVLALLLVATPVLAASAGQDVTPSEETVSPARAVDMGLFILIMGFLKEQFDLQGKKWGPVKVVVLVALFVGAIVYFSPEITAWQPVVGQIIAYLKWALGGMGVIDTAVDVKAKLNDA